MLSPAASLVLVVAGLGFVYVRHNAVVGSPLASSRIIPLTDTFRDIVPSDAVVEVLATGFTWSEGVARFVAGDGEELFLFSDTQTNIMHAWSEAGGLRPWRLPSGFRNDTVYPQRLEPGTNGLLLDPHSRTLLMCDHGHRRVARLHSEGTTGRAYGGNAARVETVATHARGGRLNSPNDLTFASDGTVVFTDPHYGLRAVGDPNPNPLEWPGCEQGAGVYALGEHGPEPLISSMATPNGLGFSPDGLTLYVVSSGSVTPELQVYNFGQPPPLEKVSTLINWRDTINELKRGGLVDDVNFIGSFDGLVVAADGTIFLTAPGGFWVLSPTGTLMGIIATNSKTTNCILHGGFLYATTDSSLVRIRVNVSAQQPHHKPQ